MKPLSILLFFLSSFILQSKAQAPQEFFLDNWQAKTALSPDYVNATSTTEEPTVTIHVDFNDTITKVSKYIYGNNAVPWAGKMNNNSALMKKIRDLQPHVLRWPGGSNSDTYFWDAVQDGGPTDLPPDRSVSPLNAGRNTTNWAMTLEEYYDMLGKTNTEGCIIVNYGYARYGASDDPVATAAKYAADWVRYDNGRTKYWEIGNENMGSWEAGYEIDLTLNKDNQPKRINGDLYGKHCRVFIDSMKAAAEEVGSDIKIGVVTMEGYVSYDNVMKSWNRLMMPHIADVADFLIIHSYYTPYNENSTVSTILNSASKTEEHKDYVLNDLKSIVEKDNLPLALTEWNIFAVGSKQQVSYINGMHSTLMFGELIKNRFGMAMRWDIANGWSGGDDHGLFARNDEPGVSEGTAHAPYYYMYYFQKYFGDHMVGTSVSGSTQIISYASTFSSGESGIVIVNKGSSEKVVQVELDNFADASSCYQFVLTGGGDNGNFSRKVFVNGEGPGGEGGGPDNFQSIKAYGKRVEDGIKLIVPPLSVTHLLVGFDEITSASKLHFKPDFELYLNPAKGQFSVRSDKFQFNSIDVFDLSGRKVVHKFYGDRVQTETTLKIELDAGIYFVNISDGENRISKKLLVK